MKLLFLFFSQIKSKLGVGKIIKSHLGRGGFLSLASNKRFPIQLALFMVTLIIIYNLIHLEVINEIINYLFKTSECSDGKSNLPVNLNITGKISITVGEALVAGGIGFGAAKMIQASPPQTRLAATMGLGGIMGATYLASNAIQTLNSSSTDNKPSSFNNSNPEEPLSKPVQTDPERDDSIININSIFEMDWIDSLSPETVLLYCCLIFSSISLYFFIGLIISVFARNFINSSSLQKRIEERLHKWGTAGQRLAIIVKLLTVWLKEGNKLTNFILSFIISYSLIANIIILLYLINFKG